VDLVEAYFGFGFSRRINIDIYGNELQAEKTPPVNMTERRH
jgi:hypothetical protein